MSPEANESPPPTRSRISSPARGVAWYSRPSWWHTALQSLTVAVRALRSVVATAAKFGKAATARSIMRRKFSGSSPERFSSTPSTSNPSAAVKSSSLPSITSTSGASWRLTSCARFWPPIDFQSDGR